MVECGKYIGGTTSFPCTVQLDPATGVHMGPCAAIEVPRTWRARMDWEKAQAHVASQVDAEPLAQFQGPPQTFQDRMADPRIIPTVDTRSGGPTGFLPSTPLAVEPDPYRKPDYPVEFAEPPQRPAPLLPEGVTTSSDFGPTKVRSGDQPLPVIHQDVQSVQDVVIADIDQRKQVGVERYGTTLQTFNGRDSLRDAYEEGLDLTIYLRQVMLERESMNATIDELESRLKSVFSDVLPSALQNLFVDLRSKLRGTVNG